MDPLAPDTWYNMPLNEIRAAKVIDNVFKIHIYSFASLFVSSAHAISFILINIGNSRVLSLFLRRVVVISKH